MSRCIDCAHFNLRAAERIHSGYARLGMGKCDAIKLDTATFVTAGYARECPRFDPADVGDVEKRVAFVDLENKGPL